MLAPNNEERTHRARDAFDAFVGERLMPRLHGLGKRGFPNPPDVKEFPVHNLQTV